MSLYIAEEDLIVDTDAEVFVVTVSQVSTHDATRAKPPRVVLTVDETIRGAKRKQIRTAWEFPFDPEVKGFNGTGPTEADRPKLREYAKEPLPNPKVGEKWLIIMQTWPDGAPPILPIAAKFPLSEKRRRWVDEQFERRKRYEAERNQYRDTWPSPLALAGKQLPDGARPVSTETLRPGTPVLAKYATTTQCYVVEVLKDGQVKVRPNGYDSRRDNIVSLDKLMLYPETPQYAAAKVRSQKWRAAMNDKVIDNRTQEADAVAIGQIVSGGTFEIETLLKGQPRMSTGGKYYVTLPSQGYDQRIADLVSERPRCILFLSEKNLIASVTDIHGQIVDPYEGIVLADAAAIAAVKASLQKRPAPKPKPVLVISALDSADAAPLAQAARATFAVVVSHQFSGHGPNTIVHVRNTIPNAGMLVMIDRGPQRRVVAVQITPDVATTLYDATWPDKDAPEQLQALTKKLVEKTN